MNKRQWLLKTHLNLEDAKVLQNELGLSLLLASLLSQRKLSKVKDAELYLQPSLKNLTDPNIFKDMDLAVKRVTNAIKNNETIGLFGDYDVDGVCSTAILHQFFSLLEQKNVFTLPNRMKEGYGLSTAGIDRLLKQGASLIIAADCGILAHEKIAYANSLGIEVIVVDHHEPGPTLPKACAIINPKRSDCPSSAHHLCAAALCFYFCLALRRELRKQGFFKNKSEPDLKCLLDLAALATVADVVPLIKDNRVLVKAGLNIIKQGQRLGLKTLMEVAKIRLEKISSSNLGFHLGPRINAAGRLEDATEALQLLNESSHQRAQVLAEQLNDMNQARRELEQSTVDEAIALLEKDDRLPDLAMIVLYQEHWHPGVVGIVASRITEKYHRPSIIIGEQGKGSGRSISGIDLHQMVLQCSEYLSNFGGHAHAIGLKLKENSFAGFKEALEKTVKEQSSKTLFTKNYFYDLELSLSDINFDTYLDTKKLEPCGAHNAQPIFRVNHCFIRNLRRLEGGHIKGELENNDGFASFIGFRMDVADDLAQSPLDFLVAIELNEWQGQSSLQLRLIDYKKSLS